MSLLVSIMRKISLRTLGHLKHVDVVLFGPYLEVALRLGTYGFNYDNRFESWELFNDTLDSFKPAVGLKEEEGDVCVVEAEQFLHC